MFNEDQCKQIARLSGDKIVLEELHGKKSESLFHILQAHN